MINSGQSVDVKICGLSSNGEGVAKPDGYTVFVDGALVGEEVLARMVDAKPNYGKARLIKVKQEASHRVVPSCSRYAQCGGCQIMHASYERQLYEKQQIVKDALSHIGGLKEVDVSPCFPSPDRFHYRNKIQLPVQQSQGKLITGFYQRGSHTIVPYERCLIHNSSMEDVVHCVRDILSRSSIKAYCEKTRKGTLRHIIIRANEQGQQLLGLVTTGAQNAEILAIAKEIKTTCQNVVGIVKSINRKRQNVIVGDENLLLVGQSFLQETIDGLTFNISLPSFFQVNIKAAKILYETAIKFAQVNERSVLLDAYCGIGTLSLLASRKAALVIGAEVVEQAVKDAKENALLNQIDNVRFIVGKVEEKTEIFKDVDVAMINPPRKGLDEKVVGALNEFGPPRLVYISCNPSTLARDLRGLKQNYQLQKVQPVDMFPQTMHVETVVQLKRIS